MKRRKEEREGGGRAGKVKELSVDSNSRSLPAETGYSVVSAPSAINPNKHKPTLTNILSPISTTTRSITRPLSTSYQPGESSAIRYLCLSNLTVAPHILTWTSEGCCYVQASMPNASHPTVSKIKPTIGILSAGLIWFGS